MPRLAVFCLLAVVLLTALSPFAAAQPVRVALHDPDGTPCGSPERSQAEAWGVRLAFGLRDDPAARLRRPWFLRADRSADTPTVRLAPDAFPPLDPNAPQPSFPWPTTFPLSGSDAEAPWLWSRLRGTTRLPTVLRPGDGEGWTPCPRWPRGVTVEPREGGGYVLSRTGDERLPALRITAYRTTDGLWGAVSAGAVDVLLPAPGEAARALEQAGARDASRVGWGRGTQQVVLRLTPALRDTLGAAGMAALSRATRRDALTADPVATWFTPARGFLSPAGVDAAENALFDWNTRAARRAWLDAVPDAAPATLAVADHPMLLRLARRAAQHWRRTLNWGVVVRPLPPERFADVVAGGDAELWLEVRDLDDGSLQDLWADVLPAPATVETKLPEPLDAPTLAAWERSLREAPPYLPLVVNRRVAVTLTATGAAALPAVCGGCAVLAPEAVQNALR